MSYIGDLIKLKRTEKDFSQRKLAELCGMSYSHICRLEKGENVPTLDTITKIANALELPLDEFSIDEKSGEVGKALDQWIEQFTKEQWDLIFNLSEFINKHYCGAKFDLNLLAVDDNYEDIRGLMIDLVKNRLNAYTVKEQKGDDTNGNR